MKQVSNLHINMNKNRKKNNGTNPIIFMGTGDYGGTILTALLLHNQSIAAVVTRPDRKGGRKGKSDKRTTIFNAVKDIAISKNIELLQPERITDDVIKTFNDINPHVVIVASYGRILPEKLLTTSVNGFVNVHGSLLPKYRGASPIQNAILAGEQETGTTIMQMDTGMDTGDIIAQTSMSIKETDTSGTLFPKMAQHGANLLVKTLPKYLDDPNNVSAQDNSQATLCQLIEREDGHVQWNESSQDIYNRFRALAPWPGIFSFWKKNETDIMRVKFLSILPIIDVKNDDAILGEVFKYDTEICVHTRKGCIILKTVQLEGKKEMDIVTFINGNPDFVGARLQ